MTRRVVHAEARPGARLTLEPRDLRHLTRVLRARPELELEVLDGKGGRFLARYCGEAPPQLEVLAAIEAVPGWEPVPLVIALGILKGARMDWAVEKLSELGAERLVPLRAARTVGAARLERWRRIARESAKQCGRARLLEVGDAVAPEAVDAAAGGAGVSRFVLDPSGERLAAKALGSPRALIAIGPEGGFTPEEREGFATRGYRRVALAVPVLRGETAALAAAAVFAALGERG